MSLSEPIIVLVAYTVIRELLFFYQVNKLLNKAMSRSFHEYRQAENIGKEQDVLNLNVSEEASLEAVGGLGEF